MRQVLPIDTLIVGRLAPYGSGVLLAQVTGVSIPAHGDNVLHHSTLVACFPTPAAANYYALEEFGTLPVPTQLIAVGDRPNGNSPV